MSLSLAVCVFLGTVSAFFAVRANTATAFVFYTITTSTCLIIAIDLILKFLKS